MKKLLLSLVGLVFVARPVAAKIYIDFEVDPLPIVQMKVLLPVGFEASKKEEVGAANLLSDMLEAGTQHFDRPTFLDKLADFGASYDFSVLQLHSEWALNFPILQNKNYSQLADLLRDNWETPRFEDKDFELARLKMLSSLKASVDNDNALAVTVLQRWMKKNAFEAFPIFIEDVQRLKKETVMAVFQRDFISVPDIWVGVVAPESSREIVKELVSKVFSKQGEVVFGERLEPLALKRQPEITKQVPKTFILIDKSDRTQTVMAGMVLRKEKVPQSKEIPFFYGQHVLFDAGLGSIYPEEIRTKRGLAYAVSSAGKFMLNKPMFSFDTNPVRAKMKEAFATLSELNQATFVKKPNVIESLTPEAANRFWRSFRFGRVLSHSTPMGRIEERTEVVLGSLSKKTYLSDELTWKASPEEVADLIRDFWNTSQIAYAAIGEAKELAPLIKQYFPDFQQVVIPYRKAISETGY